jgi:hypothetical protein
MGYHRSCYLRGSRWLVTRSMRCKSGHYIPINTVLTVSRAPQPVTIYVMDTEGDEYLLAYDDIRDSTTVLRRANAPIFIRASEDDAADVDEDGEFYQNLTACLRYFETAKGQRIWQFDPFEWKVIKDAFPEWWYNQIAVVSEQLRIETDGRDWHSIRERLINRSVRRWNYLVTGPRQNTQVCRFLFAALPSEVDAAGKKMIITREGEWNKALWRSDQEAFAYCFEKKTDALALVLLCGGEIYDLQEPAEYAPSRNPREWRRGGY